MPARIRTFKNSNTPKPVKLPKGKIEKIDFKEHEQEVRRIWEGKPPDKLVERWKERDRPHHKDKEIDMEMQRHGDRVNVVYDSNP